MDEKTVHKTFHNPNQSIYANFKNLIRDHTNKIVEKFEEFINNVKEYIETERAVSRTFSEIVREESGEKTDVKPGPGDALPSRSENGYIIIMPGYHDEVFMKFKKKADEFAGNTTGEERVKKFLEFVYNEIKYNLNWNHKKVVNLDEAISRKEGVCKEQALALYALLSSEGYDVYYNKGTFYTHGSHVPHTWLTLNINNKSYLLDPTHNLFIQYDSSDEVDKLILGNYKKIGVPLIRSYNLKALARNGSNGF